MEISGNLNDYNFFFEFLKKEKQDFTAKLGTFSAEIFFENKKYFYTDKKRGFKVFQAIKKLKNDLLPFLHEEKFEVNRKNLQYFFLKSGFQENVGKFYNIDIKRAYPQSLYNTQYVSRGTIDYIESLDKPDKLSVCGMLAYEPDFFIFKNGDLISHEKIRSDFSGCFFYCVKEIQDLMLEIIEAIDGNYFFTWVDGIFFKEDDKLKFKIIEIIRKRGYECSFEICENLKVEHKINSLYFAYDKGSEKKSLIFPDHKEINRKKYAQIQKMICENNDEKYIDELNKYFILDHNGNILF